MLEFVKEQMAAKKKTSLEEQAMKDYLMNALSEAQGQPGPGSATAQPSGAGQSTMDTMRGGSQAADIERQMEGG